MHWMLLNREQVGANETLSYGVSIALTCCPLLLEGCQLHAAVAVFPFRVFRIMW